MGGGSKGRKKLKLQDLSRAAPTQEEANAVSAALHKDIMTVNPIVAAILGIACIEFQLEKLLRRRLPRNDDDTW